MTTGPPRHATLDGLRGIAVMGILLINIEAFGLPDAGYFNPVAYGASGPADVVAWLAALIVADGKMRNLFAFLFGASLLLVTERAAGSGQSPLRAHYARMASLLLFGLVHYYLLWSGDVLSQYAVLGMIAYPARSWTVTTLLRAALALFAIQLIGLGCYALWLMNLRDAADASGADAATLTRWAQEAARIGADPHAIASEIARYRGHYADLVAYRLDHLRFGPWLGIATTGAETLAMMLLGMAGLKSGFLTGGWDRERYRRVAAWGYATGLPVMFALAAWCVASGFDSLVTFITVVALSAPVRPVLMLAHASAILLWLTATPGGLGARTIAAGRMAFTNYLLTSLAMTTLFYGYGGDLFGRIDRAALYLIVLLWCAAMLGWSKPWLARFRYGPLEWLWRSLARCTFQPMRRHNRKFV